MSYAHKLKTYSDDAFKPVVYCIVCGQESNLSSQCSGEYQLKASEKEAIEKQFNDDMKKIFT